MNQELLFIIYDSWPEGCSVVEWFAKLGIIERDLNPRVFFDPLEYTVGCGQPMESLNYGFDDNHLQDFDLDDESQS